MVDVGGTIRDSTTDARLLALIGEFLRDSYPGHRISCRLDSRLHEDLGLDSISRAELFRRAERTFGVELPEKAAHESRTVRELSEVLSSATRTNDRSSPFGAPSQHPLSSGEISPAMSATTLPQVLAWQQQRKGSECHVTLLEEGERSCALTYDEIQTRALAVAQGLRARGIGPRERVALMLPTSLDLLVAFWGVILRGAVPVPLYPPASVGQIVDHLKRQAAILRNAEASALILSAEVQSLASSLQNEVASLRVIDSVNQLEAAERGGVPDEIADATAQPDDLAFLQYTSGSTGLPKGVMLSHRSLLANIRAIGEVAELRNGDVTVSWLPLYHDMGLIGAWLGSLYYGIPLVLMSPLAFLARPERWLKAIHRYRGTVTAGPNFAYQLCAQRIPDEVLQGLDLSSWRLALNGAEPVSAHTVRQFISRFSPYGFKAAAMTPVYGLAESALGVSFPRAGSLPRSISFDRSVLQREGRAVPVATGEGSELVSCGKALPGHEIRVVNEIGVEVPERVVGALQFRGPSTSQGYFRNPEATKALFASKGPLPWCNSGDKAFLSEGEVFICGREKDLIIRGGRNIYPQEIEEAVGTLEGIRKGCVVCFAASDPRAGTEKLVVVAETRIPGAARESVISSIRSTVAALVELPPDDIQLVPPRSIRKTSSGKLRRADTKRLYEEGKLGTSEGRLAHLITLCRLTVSAPLRRYLRLLVHRLYALWVYTVTVPLFLLSLLLVLALSSVPARRLVARITAKMVLFLAGLAPRARGPLSQLASLPPHIVVVNHASYIDSIVIASVLPPVYTYVAMREFESVKVMHFLLSLLGIRYVTRSHKTEGVPDTRELSEAVRQGESLVLFPEGTFFRSAGVLPFKMGAFQLAAETGVPIIPVALAGTREILRDGTWLPTRRTAVVTVGDPIQPPSKDFEGAAWLRAEARKFIVANCGEFEGLPVLGETELASTKADI